MPHNAQQHYGIRDIPYNMKPATDHRQCVEICLPQNTASGHDPDLAQEWWPQPATEHIK